PWMRRSTCVERMRDTQPTRLRPLVLDAAVSTGRAKALPSADHNGRRRCVLTRAQASRSESVSNALSSAESAILAPMNLGTDREEQKEVERYLQAKRRIAFPRSGLRAFRDDASGIVPIRPRLDRPAQ